MSGIRRTIACATILEMASSPISLTHFSDPHCPWAYSASPAHAVLRWRFADQLDWRLVLIGLSEGPDRYIKSGYTPVRSAQGYKSSAAASGCRSAASRASA